MKTIKFTLIAALLTMSFACTNQTGDIENSYASFDTFSIEDNQMPQARKTSKITMYPYRKNVYAVTIKVNGLELRDVVVDTGCSTTALSYNDYVSLKSSNLISEKDFVREVQNFNSDNVVTTRRVYRIREIRIGTAVVNDIYCIFDFANKSNTTRLLGLNFLKKFDVSFDFDKSLLLLNK